MTTQEKTLLAREVDAQLEALQALEALLHDSDDESARERLELGEGETAFDVLDYLTLDVQRSHDNGVYLLLTTGGPHVEAVLYPGGRVEVSGYWTGERVERQTFSVGLLFGLLDEIV